MKRWKVRGSMDPTACLQNIANLVREANADDRSSTEHLLNLTFTCNSALRDLIDWLDKGGFNPNFVHFHKSNVFLTLDSVTRVIIDTAFDTESINVFSLFRNGKCVDRRIFRPAR